jgi:hypothetical protein
MCGGEFDPLWLNCIMSTFLEILTGGYLRVRPWVANMMGMTVTLALTVALSLKWFIPHPITLLLTFGIVLRMLVLVTIMRYWLTLTDGALNSLVWLGLQVGGSQLTNEEFLQPGTTLAIGVRLSVNLYWMIAAWGGDWLFAPLEYLASTLAFMALWIVFAIIALAVLLTVVEYLIVSIFAFLVWPLTPIPFLAFIADDLARTLLAIIIRLGALAALYSIVIPFAVALGLPGDHDIDIQSTMSLMIGVAILGFIIWQGPKRLGVSSWPAGGMVNLGLLAWIGIRGR